MATNQVADGRHGMMIRTIWYKGHTALRLIRLAIESEKRKAEKALADAMHGEEARDGG